jgi:hypothetical protein
MLMDILIKILVVALTVAVFLCVVIILDGRITRLTDVRSQLLARSLLYALAFTPTAYHHPPNTIVAPLHLSTICGNLFYGYEYTLEMFVYGVAVPLAGGWLLITIFLLLRLKLPVQSQKSPAR